MVLVKSADEVIKEQEAAINMEVEAEKAAAPQVTIPSLMSTLRDRWEAAKRAKIDVERQFFKNIDAVTNTYDPQKLAAIKSIGSDVYIGITETKVRHGKAWLRDALLQPGQKPWGVEPTPVPEIPADMVTEVTGKFISNTMQEIQYKSQTMGIQMDMPTAIRQIQADIPELRNKIEAELKKVAWEKSRQMEKEIDDKLIDGKWYEALDECVPDLVTHGTAVMLGPFKRNRKVLAADEKGSIISKYKVIDEFNRTSVFNVYPQPDSTGPKDGWVFVKVQYRKLDLQSLIGVVGFSNIELILEEADRGTFREWTLNETELAEKQKKNIEGVHYTDIVDCLLYMGQLSGKQLIEAGVQIPAGKENYDFLSNIWFIGNYFIKAVINEDPLERKPINIAHFEENIDGWWGRGLPQLIEAEQGVCNACARAIVNNVAMGSGPQVEINISRLKGGDKGDMRLIPWKKWITINPGMQTGPAIQFWQPQMHAAEILQVFNDFRKGADERGSIPAYSHGDPQVGGAGNTASGLSMLISQAARGIRGIIKGIDKNLIIETVGYMYALIALNPKYKENVGDVKLVAKGSQVLIEKEQRAIRLLELLNATNNPVDLQLTGAEGRGYLLGEVARTHEIDPERALPMVSALRGKNIGQPVVTPGQPGTEIPNRGTPPVVARNLVEGGMEPQGGGEQLIAGRGGNAELPENTI